MSFSLPSSHGISFIAQPEKVLGLDYGHQDHYENVRQLWQRVLVSDGSACVDAWVELPDRASRYEIPTARDGSGRIPAIGAWINRFDVDQGHALGETECPSFTPHRNLIKMPPLADFSSAASYYSTIFHELIHWTGPQLFRPSFTDPDNEQHAIVEEVIAEIGASLLTKEWSLDTIEKNAAYIRIFLEKAPLSLRSALYDLAGKAASNAVNFLNQPGHYNSALIRR